MRFGPRRAIITKYPYEHNPRVNCLGGASGQLTPALSFTVPRPADCPTGAKIVLAIVGLGNASSAVAIASAADDWVNGGALGRISTFGGAALSVAPPRRVSMYNVVPRAEDTGFAFTLSTLTSVTGLWWGMAWYESLESLGANNAIGGSFGTASTGTTLPWVSPTHSRANVCHVALFANSGDPVLIHEDGTLDYECSGMPFYLAFATLKTHALAAGVGAIPFRVANAQTSWAVVGSWQVPKKSQQAAISNPEQR